MAHAHCMIDTQVRTRAHIHTHTQYAILIAFPLQQQLHERAPMLRYAYNACLFI